MRGLIIIPTRYKNLFCSNAPLLLEMVGEKFGFNVLYTNSSVKIPSNTDVVILYAVPHHNYENLFMDYVNLSRDVKLVGYLHDLHGSELLSKNMLKMLDRYDVILRGADETFGNLYPEHLSRSIFFPNFIAPYTKYSDLKFNKDPIYKCLLSGALSRRYYPLRQFIFDKIDRSKVTIIPHPGYNKSKTEILSNSSYYIGDRYINKLHSHFCCVTTSSKFNYVLSKYIEIPATGSLLIANETNDLRKMGFIPNKHYISITKENVLETIYECLDNPNKYTEIRKDGMEFARKNHSINNRFEQFKTILGDIEKNV